MFRTPGRIGAFKLTHVASAYYKGDERNPQLQRVYGTAFKNKTEMDAYFAMLEGGEEARPSQAWARDGAVLLRRRRRSRPAALASQGAASSSRNWKSWPKETEFAAGYQRVRTPHIARESMYVLQRTSSLLRGFDVSPDGAECRRRDARNESGGLSLAVGGRRRNEKRKVSFDRRILA